MKLLVIRLQNLNSLSGEVQEVRFDKPPLSETDLFLICGQTGAGKSTLLDAITLALYGRAARYGGGKPDEMMSRQAGESLAEVEFLAGGKKLRATWRLRRARGRADGNLQPVERRLALVESGEILAEKAQDVDALVEQLTGLDLQRFMRSVLLAQGQFAAFLKARPAERAELLERITGTEIYRDLSVLAFQLWREKQDAYEKQKQLLEVVEVLDAEARVELEGGLERLMVELEKVGVELDGRQSAFQRMSEVWEGQKRIASLREAVKKLEVALVVSGREVVELERVLAGAAERESQVRRQRAEREAVWTEAEVLSERLRQSELELVQCREVFGQQQKVLKRLEEQLAAKLAEQEVLEKQQSRLRLWLEEHAEDAGLAAHSEAARLALPLWRAAFAARQEALRVGAEADKLRLELEDARLQLNQWGLEAEQANVQVREAEQEVEAIRRQLEDQQSVVKAAERVASYEDKRADLVAGDPCPLCGSAEHPYARASSELESQLAAARKLEQTLRQTCKRSEGVVKERVERQQKVNLRCADGSGRVKSLTQQLEKLKVPSVEVLRELKEKEAASRLELGPTPDQAEAVILDWEKKARAYQQKKSELSEVDLKRVSVKEMVNRLQAEVAEKAALLKENQEQGMKLRAMVDERKQRFFGLLGGRSLAEDRALHDEALLAAEKGRKIEDQRLQQAGLKRVQLETQRASSSEQLLAAEAAVAGVDPVDEADLGALKLGLQEIRQRQAGLQKEQGVLTQQLRADDQARQKRRERAQQLGAAEKDAQRWGTLKELIGSADGSKFARFAQSLSLRQLLTLANRHLQVLSPRYRLQAREGLELDMEIVDLYQGDCVRSMESLSGGESFLASLALALGVSKLASRQYPIDSLFIDEGFGTLDADTLEIALNALENLRAEGKVIGIISHVELMKQRVTSQIQVLRSSGGVSRLVVR